LFQGGFGELRSRDQSVEVGHIGPMVLAMVKLRRRRRNVRQQGVGRIGQRRQFDRHGIVCPVLDGEGENRHRDFRLERQSVPMPGGHGARPQYPARTGSMCSSKVREPIDPQRARSCWFFATCQSAVQPPSITKAGPVIRAEASDARNTAAPLDVACDLAKATQLYLGGASSLKASERAYSAIPTINVAVAQTTDGKSSASGRRLAISCVDHNPGERVVGREPSGTRGLIKGRAQPLLQGPNQRRAHRGIVFGRDAELDMLDR